MMKPPLPPSSKHLLPTDPEDRRVEDDVSYPILLSDRVKKSASEAASFKSECAEVARQADAIFHLFRSVVRLSYASYYSRPVRRVAIVASRNLERALTLTRKCCRRSLLRRVVNVVSAADFRRLSALLDASAADLRWLIAIFDCSDTSTERVGDGGGIVLSLPPIASNNPILAWVWSFIASVRSGPLSDRIEAAKELASLALDNDRNKKMIVEEGGIPPLLKLLKDDSSSSPEAQIAVAVALRNLVGGGEEWVNLIVERIRGVPLIVHVLHTSAVRVQIEVAKLVARMSEFSQIAKEEFARENVIRPLVSVLSSETFEDDGDWDLGKGRRYSIHSIVQKEMALAGKKEKKATSTNPSNTENHRHSLSSTLSQVSDQSSRGRRHYLKESPEMKRQIKIFCSEAMWMLARDSISNSRKITETKGLLCLATLVEKEHGELQKNCLMAIMEIAVSAESSADLRRSAFKTNSRAAKAVVGQLLNLIKDSSRDQDDYNHRRSLLFPAIRSIGCLARTFPAREAPHAIGPLVDQLRSNDQEVATHASVALEKFANPENFLCKEHSRKIIELDGVIPLMSLLRGNDWSQLHALVLLCYLSINARDSEALEQSKVLTALEGADRTVAAQSQPKLKELITNAVYQLKMFHNAGTPPSVQIRTHPL